MKWLPFFKTKLTIHNIYYDYPEERIKRPKIKIFSYNTYRETKALEALL